jgi:hypothetical protein
MVDKDYRSPQITGMPFGGGISDPVGVIATELSERKMLLNLACAKAEIERNRLERFIASIEDAEMRLIIRLRHVNSLTWEEIGEEIHADRRTASRKYYKFLKTPTMPAKDVV